MRIEILGSAAGGGFPQWNCNCRNCQAVRAGTFPGTARTQTQVAVTNDRQSWFLLNASPDLRLQIEAASFLHPTKNGRHSPIAAAVLTGADVDQVAGLLSLRELQPFTIYSTASIRRILQEQNSIFRMLNRVADQVSWIQIRLGESFPLRNSAGQDSGISGSVVSLGNRYPAYVDREPGVLAPGEASVGLFLECAGAKVAYLPAVPAANQTLLERLQSMDLLLFDGTFWTDDELILVQGSGSTAREMGHIPVYGSDGSLRKLSGLQRPRKVYLHINNTNPMLDDSSPEADAARKAGWEIARDGMHFEI